MIPSDAERPCAFARLCDEKGRIWNVARHAGAGARAVVEGEAGHCPGGRLVAWDPKTKQASEPAVPPSLGLIEDPAQGGSGPIWARGGIPVEAAARTFGSSFRRANVTFSRSRDSPCLWGW